MRRTGWRIHRATKRCGSRSEKPRLPCRRTGWVPATDPVETYQYNGRIIDAGHYLGEAVAAVINEANTDGVIRYDDILGKPVVADAAPPQRDEPGYAGRYSCRSGT
jgi:hypothetical protein